MGEFALWSGLAEAAHLPGQLALGMPVPPGRLFRSPQTN